MVIGTDCIDSYNSIITIFNSIRIHDTYRTMTVLNATADIIISITVSVIGRAVILVIMYVENF